jgi:hypothetical protein
MKTSKQRPVPRAVTDQPATLPARSSASLATIIASAFTRTHVTLRARVLRRLLLPVGPLALAVIGGGAFAKYVGQARWVRLSVSLEDAASVTARQVIELARYVEQSNPAVLQQVLVVLARDTTTMAALGASLAAIIVERLSRRTAD